MNDSKSSISNARSYAEMGEFWDSHSLSDSWEQTKQVQCVVDIRSDAVYFPVEMSLSKRIQDIARQHGVSAETLLNQWVQEKAAEVLAVGAAE